MLQLAGSLTLMVVVVAGAAVWAWRTGIRDRFENRR
jgi:hypothetical protein